MSQNELSNLSNVYSYTFPAAVAGVSTSPAVPNFFLGTSKVLGLKKVSGVYAGTPQLASITPSAAGSAQGCVLVANSTSSAATEVGRLAIYWINESSNSLLNA
jgi:hypothetical protein